ncbi:MAG TPA: YHS domain-containing protein, partial [Xanthobacteraceae bacterium]
MHAHGSGQGTRSPAANAGARAIDPVCGMTVDPQATAHQHSYRDHDYYFCSGGCRAKFTADPAKYLGLETKPARPAAVPAGAIYTCPMHPEIRQVGPGHCPICGMALEPVLASAEAGPDPELADMTRRFWIGLALAIPLVALDMGEHLADLHMWPSPRWSNWIELALATPVVLWAGFPFFVRGWQSLVARNLNMFTLIAMGTGVAFAYSVVGTVAPEIFPTAFRDSHGAVAVYFEAAAVITVLVLLGQV